MEEGGRNGCYMTPLAYATLAIVTHSISKWMETCSGDVGLDASSYSVQKESNACHPIISEDAVSKKSRH